MAETVLIGWKKGVTTYGYGSALFDWSETHGGDFKPFENGSVF